MRDGSSTRGSTGGSTLLELLVALGITALVLSAVYGAVTRTADARARTTRCADRLAATRAVVLALTGELAAAAPAEDAAGAERFAVARPEPGAPPWSALRFASFGPDGMERIVSYRVEAAERGRSTGALVRRAASRFAPPDSAEPAGLAVLDGVRAFGVRCFDGAAWHAAWAAAGVPRAVELTVAVESGCGGLDELATTVTMPVQARR